MFWQTFTAAILAAFLALSGNAVMLYLQGRAKLTEERRAFVRQLHDGTVDTVADVDLFIRSIRKYVVKGCEATELDSVKSLIDETWEGNLLRRIRRLSFGHPDSDVRQAAEHLEDALWPYMGVALKPFMYSPSLGEDNVTESRRYSVWSDMEIALAELRRAVYIAPLRKKYDIVPFNGETLPSSLNEVLKISDRHGT